MTRTRTFGLGVAILGGAYLALALQLPMHTLNGPGAGVFPVVVAGVLMATGALVALWPAAGPATENEDDAPGSFRATAVVFAALVAFCLLFQRLGYIASGVLLMIAVLRAFRAPWTVAAAVSVVSVLVTYAVFATLLGLTLPRGSWMP